MLLQFIPRSSLSLLDKFIVPKKKNSQLTIYTKNGDALSSAAEAVLDKSLAGAAFTTSEGLHFRVGIEPSRPPHCRH